VAAVVVAEEAAGQEAAMEADGPAEAMAAAVVLAVEEAAADPEAIRTVGPAMGGAGAAEEAGAAHEHRFAPTN
jgi:hypothetical protein